MIPANLQTKWGSLVLTAMAGMTAGMFGAAVSEPLLGLGLALIMGEFCYVRDRGPAEIALAIGSGVFGTALGWLMGPSLALACGLGGTVLLLSVWLVRDILHTWRRGYEEAQRAYRELVLPTLPMSTGDLHGGLSTRRLYESGIGQLMSN